MWGDTWGTAWRPDDVCVYVCVCVTTGVELPGGVMGRDALNVKTSISPMHTSANVNYI